MAAGGEAASAAPIHPRAHFKTEKPLSFRLPSCINILLIDIFTVKHFFKNSAGALYNNAAVDPS